MAHEIRVTAEPGLTLTAQLWQGVTQAGGSITLTEAAAGYYTGSVPGGTPAGAYDVHVLNGTQRLASSSLRWSGMAEILPAAAGDAMAMTSGERALHFAEHDATQAAVGLIVGISDPLMRPVPGTYPAGSAGEALGRLVVPGDPETPVVVIPAAPNDVTTCRVYGYVEGADNRRLVGARVKFVLMPRDKAVASNRLIAGREINLSTNDEGRIVGPGNDPWVDLQRTDLLSAEAGADVFYEVTSTELGVSRKRVELTTSLADLRALLLA